MKNRIIDVDLPNMKLKDILIELKENNKYYPLYFYNVIKRKDKRILIMRKQKKTIWEEKGLTA